MNHDSYDPSYIAGILNAVKTVAMVGASANDVRPSFFVMKYLIAKGFSVFPVNPGQAGRQILGQTVYARLADIPVAIDMVDVFRASDAVPAIVDEVLKLDPLPKVIWMQLGVRHDEAAARAEAAGIQVVMNRCPKIEYGQIFRRDRMDRRQQRRAVVEEADHARRFPEFRRPPALTAQIRPRIAASAAIFIPESGHRGNFLLCFALRLRPRMAADVPPQENQTLGGNNDPAHSRLQHACRPCRRQARPGHRRPRRRRSTRRRPTSSTMPTMPRRCSA